jgi:hypothetical protein
VPGHLSSQQGQEKENVFNDGEDNSKEKQQKAYKDFSFIKKIPERSTDVNVVAFNSERPNPETGLQ